MSEILVTTDPERQKMVQRVKRDLEKQAIRFSAAVIEQVLNAYDRRVVRQS